MKKKIISFAVAITMLIFVMFQSAVTGSIQLSVWDLVHGLFTGEEQAQIVKDLRFPRIIVGMLAGATLSVAGALLQAVVRNPLAEPGIIGISSGAGFFSVLIIYFFPTLFFYVPLFAFFGGSIAFLFVYSLSWKSGFNPLRLILIGVAVNAVFTGLLQIFNFTGSSMIEAVGNMTMSDLSMKNWSDVNMISIYGAIGLFLSYFVYAWCNYLALDDKTAKSLGFNVNIARFVIAAIAVLLASIATSIAGMFAFAGLIVPHIGRSLVGTDYKLLIPFSALIGALLILAADTLGRTIVSPNEIPASVIVSLIGGPFLIILLRKSDRVYGS